MPSPDTGQSSLSAQGPFGAPASDPAPQPTGYPQSPQASWFPTATGPAPQQFSLVPRRKKSPGKIFLLILVGLLLLCGGGGGAAFYFLKDDLKEAATAAGTRVVAPDEVLGKPKIVRADVQQTLDNTIASLRRSVRVTSTVAAAYGDLDRRDVVMVFAGSIVNSDPAHVLDSFILGLSNGELTEVTMASVEAGPLGGVAKCGDARAAGDITMGVCVWADRGSFGMVTLYFKTGEELNRDFVTIRGLVEQKG